MILKIAQLGQPVLRRVADPVDPDQIASAEFQQFLDDMHETLLDAPGVGLAGPQVFRSQRVFLAAVLPTVGRGKTPGIEVFINPRLTDLAPEKECSWEGCLSFIELLVDVPRHTRLLVEYHDRAGARKSIEAADFHARVIQHEYDHLDGILTIDRAESPRHIVKASEIDAATGADADE